MISQMKQSALPYSIIKSSAPNSGASSSSSNITPALARAHTNNAAIVNGMLSPKPTMTRANTNSAAVSTNTGQAPHKQLANYQFHSMFSLRGNKTMRLQRRGPWIAYTDPESNSVFWYNHETQQGQWEKPEQVIQWEAEEETQDNAKLPDKQTDVFKKVSSCFSFTYRFMSHVYVFNPIDFTSEDVDALEARRRLD